jgi:DNA-binding NarL/FixJ family response regulator
MAAVSIASIGSSRLFHRWIKLQLAGSDFDVVAEAATLREAMPRLSAGRDVDLSLLDSLGDSGGSSDEIRRMRLLLPRAKIVVLAATPTVDLVRTALSIGIDGCLSSAMPSEALIQSLYCILLGQSLFTTDGTTLLLGPPVRRSPRGIARRVGRNAVAARFHSFARARQSARHRRTPRS